MKCPNCGTEMKALLTSEYCPNDCDRIPTAVEDTPTGPIIPPGLFIKPQGSNTFDEWEKALDEWCNSWYDKTPVDNDPPDFSIDDATD